MQATNSDSVLIGNKFSGSVYDGLTKVYGFLGSGGILKAYNNLIDANGPSLTWTGMYLNAMASEIVNNTVSFRGIGNYQAPFRGVQVNGAGTAVLRGNVIAVTPDFSVNCNFSVVAVEALGSAGQTVFVSHSDLMATNIYLDCGNVTGARALQGVTPPPVNCLVQVMPNLAVDGSPNPGSPCINAGPPDAVYNNRDGTRNTMGYTGGPYWNPANYTNNNPMVFLLTGQQTVAKGVQTTIPINAAATAGH